MNRNKGGLGRGLDALLGGQPEEIDNPLMGLKTPVEAAAQDAVIDISLGDIDPNPDQPRKTFDEAALQELAASIRQVGVLQPIIVRRTGSRYAIIAGERRWRAARLAGLSEIPAIVRNWDEIRRLEAALVENLQRDDLNPVEEAMGVRALMDQCGLTQEAVSERLGKSRSAVANLLRLLGLPEEILAMLRDGRLSAGHARALVPLPKDRQLLLARLCAAQGWSVRQMEKACAAQTQEKPRPPKKPQRDPQMRELERMASGVFGVKAELSGDEKSGRLIMHYKTADDLQRIWELLELFGQNEA